MSRHLCVRITLWYFDFIVLHIYPEDLNGDFCIKGADLWEKSTQSLNVMTKLYKLNPLTVKPAIFLQAFCPVRFKSDRGC